MKQTTLEGKGGSKLLVIQTKVGCNQFSADFVNSAVHRSKEWIKEFEINGGFYCVLPKGNYKMIGFALALTDGEASDISESLATWLPKDFINPIILKIL